MIPAKTAKKMAKLLVDKIGDVDETISLLEQFSEMSGLNGKVQFVFEEIKNNLPKLVKKTEVA